MTALHEAQGAPGGHEGRRPLVSVVIPAVNEEHTIGRALEPLLADPLGDAIEVIVAVGPSRDRTRDVVLELARRDWRVRLVDNPGRTTPEGLNAAIRASHGDIIARMDAHAEPEAGYLGSCLAVLNSSGAWNVGGRIRKIGTTRAARAAAAATSSPFGIGGGNRFHLLAEAGDVDTLWPGFWPRWVFERVGLFDPEMVQNQDDEFNQRILDGGGRIRLDPSIGVAYFSRGSWRGLVRQYARYGMFKVRGFQKRPASLRIRHLIPPVLVAGLAIGLGLAVVRPVVVVALAAGALIWLAAAVVFGRRVATAYDSPVGDVVAAYGCLHLGYGLGVWAGLVRFAPRWVHDRAGRVPALAPRAPAINQDQGAAATPARGASATPTTVVAAPGPSGAPRSDPLGPR
jgi:succinoglycan biosynthesis protein ExoA